MDSPPEGRRRFTFRQTLGRGGFGEVYLAEMTAPSGLTSAVAVKVLHGGLDPRSQAVQRLKDEARILSLLHHPAIVGVHDLAILDGRIAMVTEFVEGADLPDCMEGSDPMPRGVLLEAWAQVAGALDAAHNATDARGTPLSLLHRDVKPRNVRVGKHGQVKLLDFGIATGTGFERDANTQTGALVGSFPYVAPERFKRKLAPTPASDVYSLGCSIAETLRGEMAFISDDVAGFVAMKLDREQHDTLVEEHLAPLDDHPPGLKELLRAMMAYEPDGRPSCAEIIPRLEDLAGDAGGPRLARWARTHVWPDLPHDAGGALSGQTVTESSGLTTSDTAVVPEALIETLHASAATDVPAAAPEPAVSAPTRPPPVEIPEPAPRGRSPLWLALGVLLVGLVGVAVFLGATAATGVGVWAMGSGSADVVPPEPTVPGPVAPEPPPDPVPTGADTDAVAAIEPVPTPTPEPGGTVTPDGGVVVPAPVEPAVSVGVPTPIPDPAQATASSAGCGDLVALEAPASTGALPANDRACLVGLTRDASARMTDRQKAGRVVLADAAVRCRGGSCADYEREQAYYLQELDRSDPDMMLTWAQHLGKAGRHADARVWVGRALERKSTWGPRDHATKVLALRELDARSALALWKASPRDESLRLEARDAAVEWASWAGRLNRDTSAAMETCASTEGSMEPCNRRVHDTAARMDVRFTASRAGLDVLVDGEKVGVTPVVATLRVGTHAVEIRGPFGPVTQSIEVGNGKPVRWDLNVDTSELTGGF